MKEDADGKRDITIIKDQFTTKTQERDDLYKEAGYTVLLLNTFPSNGRGVVLKGKPTKTDKNLLINYCPQPRPPPAPSQALT